MLNEGSEHKVYIEIEWRNGNSVYFSIPSDSLYIVYFLAFTSPSKPPSEVYYLTLPPTSFPYFVAVEVDFASPTLAAVCSYLLAPSPPVGAGGLGLKLVM